MISSDHRAPSHALVLFDIDGTVMANAGGHHKAALMEGIRRVTGLATTLDGVPTSGTLDRDLIAAMMAASGASARRIRSNMGQVVHECQAAYCDSCATDLRDRLCPGIPGLIAELHRAGAIMGVVTGNLSRIGWKKLELAGLRDYFALGAFAEDAASRTRLARIAAQRARKAGLIRKSSCISLIGDHMKDVEAAKANGFQAVAVATGVTPYDELAAAHPDILVRDLTELHVTRLL
ncbi:MAG: haloacid dehalogenase-like hydrolase [Acidobacteriaceae bacterium]|nr:haloacid dehalogenase-like hydrolase [Acidobacteriaceae bacterium]